MAGEWRLRTEPTVERGQQRLLWASQAIDRVAIALPDMSREDLLCETLRLAQVHRHLLEVRAKNQKQRKPVDVIDIALDELELEPVVQAWVTDLDSADGKSTLRLLREISSATIETAERLTLLAKGCEVLPFMASQTFGATLI